MDRQDKMNLQLGGYPRNQLPLSDMLLGERLRVPALELTVGSQQG